MRSLSLGAMGATLATVINRHVYDHQFFYDHMNG
jgi:hypothetical protein